MALIKRVLDTIEKHQLVRPGDKVVVAVSGGPDSIALLHVLDRLKESLEISLHVVHVNHMFRGAEADQEAQMVEEFAKSLGLPVTVFRVDVPKLVKQRKQSKQAVAREIRYDCLNQVAHQVGARLIATGHHGNDQAETILLHLIRGSGLTGLRGILPIRGDKYIRPLLEVHRQAIEAYCQANHLTVAHDPSNATMVYLRNRVRNQLLPALEELNPSIVAGLMRLGEVVRAEEEYLEDQLARAVVEVTKETRVGWEIELKGFMQLPLALQRRVVRWVLMQVRKKVEEIDFDQIERVINLANRHTSGVKLQLGAQVLVRRSYNRMIFGNTEERRIDDFSYPLRMPGTTVIPEIGVVVEVSYHPPEEFFRQNSPSGVWLDLDKTGEQLVVRSRQPGDRFRPQGAPGSKKVKDFLIDQKIDRRDRAKLPILLARGKIAAVGSLRGSADFALDNSTKRSFRVWIKSLN